MQKKSIYVNRLESVIFSACNCVVYRPELNTKDGGCVCVCRGGGGVKLNFEDLEMQKWNIPTNKAQRVNEKNGVIYLAITFTPRVVVIEMLRMAHFLYFLLIAAKTQSQFWSKYLRASERSCLTILRNAMNYWILGYH